MKNMKHSGFHKRLTIHFQRWAKRMWQWYTRQQIRVKMIITTGILVIVSMSALSFLLLHHGKSVLNERLEETCNLSLQHVSQAIKEDLLLYYLSDKDINTGSVYAGHIREAIHDIYNEDIQGLVYAGVIDRNGSVVAHTDQEQINKHIVHSDSLYFADLLETSKRVTSDVIEYIHPLFVKRGDDNVFLGVTILGFSRNEVMQPINRATQTIITTSFLLIVLSVLLVFYVAKKMTGQIDALSEGVRRVGRGNLNVQIPVITRDELGQLAKEFNGMIVHLREKMQMQKFVSKLTVQMIRKRSTFDNLLPIGERRMVTCLFSDVRNFSNLTERLAPEEIVELINIYLDLQSRIIEENHGIVDKLMGDQVMAIYLGDNQADHAIRAAVEMQRAIRELNARRRKSGQVVLTVGCGLHIGPAVMGNMGSKSRLDYTVIGDVVNLASRLCAVAKPGQIIAPLEMVQQLDGEYPTIRLNPIRVKGRSQTVQVFEIDYDRAIIM